MPDNSPDLLVKLEADLKAKYEADIAAVKSAKDREISALRTNNEELTEKMVEGKALMDKLGADDSAKKAAEATSALREKLIKEGTPEELLKFAETPREMNMIAALHKTMPKPFGTILDTGTGTTTSPTGKPSLTRDGSNFNALKEWAEAEQTKVRLKYGI